LDVRKRYEEDQIPEQNRLPLDLREANLQRAHLIGEQIEWAIGDEATTLPDGLDRPAAWSKSVE
jgi:hypothetical protein